MQILDEQDGVIGRRQLLAIGHTPNDIRRMLRRRDLAVVLPGAYVNHTGPPTWLQRAWAALATVAADPGLGDVALSHESALRIAEGPGRREATDGPIHVMVRCARRLHPPPAVVVHRCEHFDERVAPGRRPPRIRYEEAILDVASLASEMDSLGLLARAVGDRRTTAKRLMVSIEQRGRIRNRAWLMSVLADVDQGTHSVLEHGFLTRVTRPHGLPDPGRQIRETTALGVVYRDAAYGGLLVELDGRLFHSSFDRRDADLDRDLVAAVTGRQTARLGWGQVFGRPCFTAAALSRLVPGCCGHPCGPDCLMRRSGGIR